MAPSVCIYKKYGKKAEVKYCSNKLNKECTVARSMRIVEGSVAVDIHGHWLGKGYGYGDVEIRTLRNMFGRVFVVTTVQNIRFFKDVLFEEKDERILIIVTRSRIIRV